MKTSNIVLLTALIIVFSVIIISMLYVKSVIKESFIKGDGNIIEDTRESGTFSTITIKGGVKVLFSQKSSDYLIVEADSNLIEMVYTKTENDELLISTASGLISKNVIVYLSAENIDLIRIKGGGEFHAKEPIKAENLILIANGGGFFELEGEFYSLELSLTAGSGAEITGSSDDLSVIATAGSNLKAKGFIADNVNIAASAGSNLEVYAKKSLKIDASVGSNVFYYGNPETKTIITNAGATAQSR